MAKVTVFKEDEDKQKKKHPEIPEKFKPLEDAIEIRNLIEQAQLAEASVVLWLKDQEEVIRSTLNEDSDFKTYFSVAVPDEEQANRFVSRLKNASEEECNVFVYLQNKAIIGMQTQFVEHDGDSIRVKIPEQVFRVQRRRHPRYSIRRGYNVQADFKDPAKSLQDFTSKKVLDISAGGLSFLIDEEEAEFYKDGMIMWQVKFNLRNRMIYADLEIRNLVTIPEGRENSGVRVGVMFRRISRAEVDFINRYIIEQTVQFG